MKSFIYLDNASFKRHIVFLTTAESITEADAKYQKMTGVNPSKQSHISCQVHDTDPLVALSTAEQNLI